MTKQPIRKIGFGLALLLSLGLLLWLRELVSWRPQLLGKFSNESSTLPPELVLSPNGHLLFVSHSPTRPLPLGNGRIWDCERGRMLAALPAEYAREYGEVAFSPDSRFILLSLPLMTPPRGVVLAGRTGKVLREIRAQAPAQTDSYVYDIFEWSPDSREIWCLYRSGVRRFNAQTGQFLGMRRYCARARSYQFSPNGKQVQVLGNDKQQRVYDSTSAQLLHLWENRNPIDGWAPDGSVLWKFDRTAQSIEFYRVKDWQLVGRIPRYAYIGGEGVLPDSKTLAVSTANGLELRDIASGKVVRTLPGPREYNFVISSDGSFTLSFDKKGHLWRWRLG